MKELINILFLPSVFLLNKCFLCENETQKITGNCGGTFSGYQYMISSPDYPSKYPENQDCIYFLRGSRLARCDQEFHLQFLDLDLRPSENCEEDFLQIGDRNIYCGTTVGLRTFKGENNILKVRFHSGKEGGGKGFRILVTTLPCVNSKGNSNNLTIRNVTPRTVSASLKPEKSTKLFYEGKIDKENQKTIFDQVAQRENSNINFEVETLSPAYRTQVTFSSENDIHQPPFDPKPRKNCSAPQDIRKLGSSTYLFLPPSSTPSKLHQFKNSNFSIKSASTEFSLPILEATPFRPGQQNVKKLTFETTPLRSNQQNSNQLTSERQQTPGNSYGESINNIGVAANNCDKNDDDLEFNKGGNRDESLPDKNFQGNLGDFPSFGNGLLYPGQIGGNGAGYPGQIGGGGIVGHPLPGIGNSINSGNYPGNPLGNYPGQIGEIGNPLPGIGSGIYPGSSGIGPGVNPGIVPGLNPVTDYPGQIGGSGVVGNPLPGIGTGIQPGISPEIGPGANPGIDYPVPIGGSGVVGNALPGIGSEIVPGLNPGIDYPGKIGGSGVVGNPLPGIGSGFYPGSSGISPGLNPGQIPNLYPNPIYPNLPNYAPNYPGILTRPECCAPLLPSTRSLISTPGFPTLHSFPIPYECRYTIIRYSPYVCRLRINFKFFNLGIEEPYCSNGHLEVENIRVCGCKSGQSLDIPFGNYPAMSINVRYSGFPNSKFSGFLIEVLQEVCGDYYPLFRNRKDLSAVNGSSSSLGENDGFTVSSKSINSSEGSHARRKREGYSYPKPTGHAILDVHSGGGRSERLFWNACQARVFLDWVLAAKEAFIRGARCPGSGSSGINPIIPILGGSAGFRGYCEEIAALEGVISSPLYPRYYPNNIRKCYRFHKYPGFCRLELSILDFDLEPSLGCSKDYLLFSGEDKRFCGNSLSGATTVFDISRSNFAEIYFVTDLSRSGRGFTAGFAQTHC